PPARVAPTTESNLNTLVDAFKTVGCVKLNDPAFAFDSSFVGPNVADDFEFLVDLRERLSNDMGKPPLSIFGHADPTGNDDYNKVLSGRRARAIYAMLIRDTDAWEDLFSHPFGGDDWGVKAIQIMFEEVGHTPGSS